MLSCPPLAARSSSCTTPSAPSHCPVHPSPSHPGLGVGGGSGLRSQQQPATLLPSLGPFGCSDLSEGAVHPPGPPRPSSWPCSRCCPWLSGSLPGLQPLGLTPEPSPTRWAPIRQPTPTPPPPRLPLAPWEPCLPPFSLRAHGVCCLLCCGPLCVCVCTQHASVCASVWVCSWALWSPAGSLSVSGCLSDSGRRGGVLKGPLICSDRPGCRGPGRGAGCVSGCSRAPPGGAAGRGPRPAGGGVGVGVGTREEGRMRSWRFRRARAPGAGCSGHGGRSGAERIAPGPWGRTGGWWGEPCGLAPARWAAGPHSLPGCIPSPEAQPRRPAARPEGCKLLGSRGGALSLWGAGEVLAWALGPQGRQAGGEPSPPWQPRRGKASRTGPCLYQGPERPGETGRAHLQPGGPGGRCSPPAPPPRSPTPRAGPMWLRGLWLQVRRGLPRCRMALRRWGIPRSCGPCLSHSWLQLALLQCCWGFRTVSVLPGLPSSWPSWPGLLAGYSGWRRGRTGKWVPQRALTGSWGWREGEERSHSGSTPPPSERAVAGPAQAWGSTPPALCALGVDSGGEGVHGPLQGSGFGGWGSEVTENGEKA